MPEPSTNIGTVKDWFTFIVAVIACVAGVIFWVQQSSDGKIKHVEKEIAELRADIDKIRDNNNEILRIIGRLEGKLERRKRQ